MYLEIEDIQASKKQVQVFFTRTKDLFFEKDQEDKPT